MASDAGHRVLAIAHNRAADEADLRLICRLHILRQHQPFTVLDSLRMALGSLAAILL
jgi:hypothetical protein